MAWAFIQEGGSSTEFYVSVYPTEADANAARKDCADDGAYRTTPVAELPDDTDWSAVEILVQSLGRLDFPDDAT